MILLTTSRRPYHATRLLARELSRVLPQARYLPRGGKTIFDLLSLASRFKLRGVWVVENREGKPGLLRCLLPHESGAWEELLIEFAGFRLQRDSGMKVAISPARIEVLPGGEPLASELSRFLPLPVASGAGAAVLIGREEMAFWDGEKKIPPELQISSWRRILAEA